MLRVRGKGGRVVLIPLPPAVARAIERAVNGRLDGPILRSTLGTRMDRHAATRRLKHLASTAGVRMPRKHPHMLRHTFVTTSLRWQANVNYGHYMTQNAIAATDGYGRWITRGQDATVRLWQLPDSISDEVPGQQQLW
ncbi:tyrosine-type recombinase/integrase [Dactylosporangium maewongense]|uniref:tyrosine-type recombinase/integrase n=1 Tax=Dactylosporangium maewongense TaxID=634393 RepID=UPI0031DEBBC9